MVRRTVSVLFVALMTLGGLSGPALADPGDDNASAQCREAEDFGQTHGACVANAVAGNFTPTIANFCRDETVRAELAEQLGVAEINHGQCMKFYEDVFPV